MSKSKRHHDGGAAVMDPPGQREDAAAGFGFATPDVATIEGIEVADELPPVPVTPRVAAGPAEWRFSLKSNWLAPFVVVIGAKDEAEARAELHRYLDMAISNVQRTGR